MLIWFMALLAMVAIGVLVIRFAINPMTAPVARGLTPGGLLHPCPDTPNCVSTNNPAAEAYIDPIVLTGSASLDIIVAALPAAGHHEIAEHTDGYLHAVFKTPLMGYRDDVEFAPDPADPHRIQVRSASRLGKSDLGANRKRIERLRSYLAGGV